MGFTIKNQMQNSIIGLLDYPLKYGCNDTENMEEKELNIKEIGIYVDMPLNESRFHQSFYGVGTPNGNEKKFRIWTPNKHKMINKELVFKDGDKLIFCFDFGQKQCKVYVNQMSDKYLISDDNADYTFSHIPEQFIIVYGAHSVSPNNANDKTAKKQKVEVKLLEVTGKGVTVKRKKKEKNKAEK